MKKREAADTVVFHKYLTAQRLHGAFELKHTETDSIPFSSFEDHQLNGLVAIQESGLIYKLPDTDVRIKPCDIVHTPPMVGYCVVRYPKAFVLITVNNFLHARIAHRKKSLSYEKACDIATKIIYV